MPRALLGRILLFVASAGGSILATLGFSDWVVVCVAASTGISRVLANTRVEDMRKAHSRAASKLNAAKLAWTALAREQRTQQSNIDRLVLAVEDCAEKTLPPPAKDEEDTIKETEEEKDERDYSKHEGGGGGGGDKKLHKPPEGRNARRASIAARQ